MQVLETQLRLEVCLLQAGLEGVQEATSVRTVDHAVIVGEGQVAHGADSDNVVTINILNNHGALHDGPVPRIATFGWLMIGVRTVHRRNQCW